MLVERHIYKKDTVIDLKAFKFFLYFEFEFRKSRTIKGDTMHKLQCATMCSNTHQKYPHALSQDSKHFIPTLWLSGLSGIAACASGTVAGHVALPQLDLTVRCLGIFYISLPTPNGHLDHSTQTANQGTSLFFIEGSQAPNLSTLDSLANL